MRRPAPHPLRHPASRHARATSCACGCLALSWDPAGDGITQEDTRGQRSSASTRCGEIGITLPRPVSEMEGSMVSSPRSRSRSSQRRSMVSPTRSPVKRRKVRKQAIHGVFTSLHQGVVMSAVFKAILVEDDVAQVDQDGVASVVAGLGDIHAPTLHIVSIHGRRVGVWYLSPSISPESYEPELHTVVFVDAAEVGDHDTTVRVQSPQHLDELEVAAVAAVLANAGLFLQRCWTFRLRQGERYWTVKLEVDPENYGSYWNCTVQMGA